MFVRSFIDILYPFFILSVECDSLICRSCGHTVVDKVLLANVRSKLALRSYNMTILGRNQLVQVFENPVPESFDVITASSADLKLQGKAYMHATWFPGFEWTVGMCPHCSAHLGWHFQSGNIQAKSNKTFVGLVLDYLISDQCL